MFSYKLFRQSDDIILAISDPSIIGRTFEDGDLTLTVSKDFYFGNSCDSKKAADLIKNATIVNAVGKDIIGLMIKKKFIKQDSVITIEGMPHAQIVAVAK